MRRDQHLVAAVLQHHRLVRKDLQPLDHRVRPGGPAIGGAGSNPAQDRPVVCGSFFEAHPPAVGLPQGRFQQEEAVLGGLEVDAGVSRPSGLVGEHLVAAALDNPVVIFRRMHGIGGESKPASAFHPAVTTAAVAALAGQNSGYVGDEAGRIPPAGLAGPDRGPGAVAAQRCPERGFTVGDRNQLAFRTQAGHLGVGNREAGLRRHLPLQAVRAGRQHQNPLAGAGSRQRHLLRHQPQGDDLRGCLSILGQDAHRHEASQQADRQAQEAGSEFRPETAQCDWLTSWTSPP